MMVTDGSTEIPDRMTQMVLESRFGKLGTSHSVLYEPDLFERISTLMFFNGEWHARARESNSFGKGPTPRDAVEQALGVAPSLEDLFG